MRNTQARFLHLKIEVQATQPYLPFFTSVLWTRYLRGNVLWGLIQINVHVHDDFFLLRMQVGAAACTAVTCIRECAFLVVENVAALPWKQGIFRLLHC